MGSKSLFGKCPCFRYWVAPYNEMCPVFKLYAHTSGPSSLGVPGVPWHTQILADQLTLFQPGGTDYVHLITTGTLGFSDLPTALVWGLYVKEALSFGICSGVL